MVLCSSFEDIQVTNASLAEGHSHPAKRDDDDEDLDERRARGRKTAASAQGRHDDERARLPEAKIREILKILISHRIITVRTQKTA